VASTLVSWGGAFARRIPVEETRAADRGLITIVALVGVMLFTAECIRDRARLDTVLRRFSNLAAACAAIGIVQFVTGFDPSTALHIPGLGVVNSDFISIGERSNFRRVASTTLHPIEFGYVLALAFPLVLHYAFWPPRETSRWRRWLPVVLVGTAIPMALSRTAALGVIVAALVLVPTWDRRRQLRAAGTTAVALVVFRIVFPGVLGTMLSLFTAWNDDTSVGARASRYTRFGHYFSDSPIIGRGFHTLLPTTFTLDNQYLLTLIEVGIVGLVALLGVLGVGFALARRARRASDDPATRDLGQSLAAAIAVPAIAFGTFDALSFPVACIATFFVVGAAGALWRIQTTTPPPPHANRETRRAMRRAKTEDQAGVPTRRSKTWT
jgi:polysaccharide biosynthesis protein PslJ